MLRMSIALRSLKTLYKRMLEPDMDVRLVFAVQDVPSEALAFSNKAEAD
jgi:hypothetical protein